MASDIWLRTILIVRREIRLAARVLLYAPSHRQDSTYHGFCYTSRGALAGTRNSSMGPWRIDPLSIGSIGSSKQEHLVIRHTFDIQWWNEGACIMRNYTYETFKCICTFIIESPPPHTHTHIKNKKNKIKYKQNNNNNNNNNNNSSSKYINK